MRKYGEGKMARIMMATVPHVTSGSGLRKFQADGFLLDRVYIYDSISLSTLRMRKFSDKSCRENQNIHILLNNIFL